MGYERLQPCKCCGYQKQDNIPTFKIPTEEDKKAYRKEVSDYYDKLYGEEDEEMYHQEANEYYDKLLKEE